MKIGIIGAGAVGAACAFALVTRGTAREIVIIDRVRPRAKAVATDLRYGTPLGAAVAIADGDYDDLAGCALVMITAGVNEATGGATDRKDASGRLRLLDTNAGIYREIVPKIVGVAPASVILVVTDPPDPLADLARMLAGHDRVLSTGTYLDSLRFKIHLAALLEVDAASVEAQILGEHGRSEVFVWSGVRVAGVPLEQVVARRGLSLAACRERVESEVRYANITIIEGNKASQYGIGIVSARIAEMVLRDERTVVPVGLYNKRFEVTLSLPTVVGRTGGSVTLEPPLAPQEEQALQRSAATLREALSRLR
jgi:L-lactate dehydrogenase